jgi:hypothetical protein
MSSVVCTNEREEHPDDRERVDEKTAHWSLSVGWFKLKILIKRGSMVETLLNSGAKGRPLVRDALIPSPVPVCQEYGILKQPRRLIAQTYHYRA